MKNTAYLFILLGALTMCTRVVSAQPADEAKVMLLGVFHFANPGLDAVKTEQINVMTQESQRYLEKVTEQLADFAPTHVLLECLPESAPAYTEEFLAYLAGDFQLKSRESYQLGFRIAEKADLKELHCYDDRSVEWEVEPMMEYLSQNESALFEKFNDTIASITADIEQLHKTLGLEELLLQHNSQEFDDLNKSIYLTTNAAGAGAGFEGANAAASWWHRNFRMYGIIQAIAQPGTRLIVIGGQGHTAILKDLLRLDADRSGVSVLPFLKSQ